MTSDWVSVVALLGWLVLAGSALRARQLNASNAVLYALMAPVPQIAPFVAMFALSSAVAAACVLVPLMAKLPRRTTTPGVLRSRAESRRNLRKLFAFCIPLVGAQLAYMAWCGLDTLLVVHQIGGDVAGRFGVAKTLSAVIILFPAAANAILLPIASRGSQAEARNALKWILLAGVAVFLVGVILSVVVGPWVVTTLFARRYAGAAPLLPGLVLGMAMFSLYSFLATYATGRGAPGIYTWSVVIGVAVEALTAIPLVNRFGAMGASYCGFVGGTVAFAVATLLLMRSGHLLTGRPSSRAPWLRPPRMEQAGNVE